ncbi:MAG: LysM peptidoglycan-binding domain-containing protein [Armatimonadetes bacterium]|nr:LysM peptidoglycan-binding domain-containing protein [Armatimonadota bacterium]
MSSAAQPVEARSVEVLEPTEFFQVGKESPGLRIYLRYELFRALDDFAVRDTSTEQAGLLVGQVQQGEEGTFLLVEDALEIGVDDAGGGRFTPRSWQHARRIAGTRYPRKSVVGWFHTHPGSGLELSAEEVEVHDNYFPEAWQIVYVVDPVQKDRNFHRREEGKLLSSAGFRIYGKESPASMSSHPAVARKPSAPDDHLKERYLERSLDKIQRMLRRPPMQAKDYVIAVLLLLNMLVLLFRPAPPARVDQTEVLKAQAELGQKMDLMQTRLDSLERHLAALDMIDQELALAPADAPSETAPAGDLEPPPPVFTDRSGNMVRLHKVKQGDTLSTISEKYYQSSAPRLVSALGRFNRLTGPGYEIFPGETVKIPPRKNLKT